MVCTADYVWRGRGSDWGQLVTATRGMLTVRTDEGWWVAPPGLSVWLPPGTHNSIEMAGRVVLWALYLRAPLIRGFAPTSLVLSLSPLFRELWRRVIELKTLNRRRVAEQRLVAVLLDELAALGPAALGLPSPRDPRARRAAELIRQAIGRGTRAESVARGAAASERTLARLFRRETGMSLGGWRRRAALLHGLQRLADGASVTEAGLAAGYEGTSAFVAAFRRAFGVTPGKYFAGHQPWSDHSMPYYGVAVGGR